jgi:hypothetical protein
MMKPLLITSMIVVGGCETTSLLGPGLGGGHGFLQGKYGLISDQFVSARMVLADGSIKDISADSGDPDLWWAIQGAGHNFGLVTSISVKIYDIEEGDVWSYRSYTFGIDKVEPLYELVNKLWPDGTAPSHLTNFSFLWRIPTVDAEMVTYPPRNLKSSSPGVHIRIYRVQLTPYVFI